MTAELNTNAGFTPIHDAHAIEQVAFVFRFSQPLSDIALSSVRTLSEQFEKELPGKHDLFDISFSVPPTQVGSQAAHQPNGILLRRTAPDGTLEHELRVERLSLSFVTTRYTRWDSIWEMACKYFDELLPFYIKDSSLSAVSLNYVDKFAWSGNPTNCDPKALIKTESKYISKHILDTNEFWHSYTGSFIRVDGYTKRLLNINIDCLDEQKVTWGGTETKRIVSIMTIITDNFNQPDYQPLDLTNVPDVIALAYNHMQKAHVFGKDVLSDIITEQMCRRIALKA